MRVFRDLFFGVVTVIVVSMAIFAIYRDAGIITVTSASMVPTLRTGDTAITIQESKEDLISGDIVVLPHPTDPQLKFAHRVVAIGREDSRVILETKGDANPVKDAWQLEIISATVPKVVITIPTSHLPFTLKERKNLTLALLGFALLAIVISLRRFRGDLELGARLGQGGRSD